MIKQKSKAHAQDTRGTNATRSDNGGRANPSLNAPPGQDVGTKRQYAGDVGKDGSRGTKASAPRAGSQTGGQRGQGRKVGDDGSQASEPQRFESGNDNHHEWTTPGRDAGIYQHDAADRVREVEVDDRRRLSDRDDDDDDNLRHAVRFDDDAVSRTSGNDDGGKQRPYDHQDRGNRNASQKTDDRRGQRQR